MKEENIHRVLEIGIKTICRKGYHNLGLRELLESADIPSGSFYYYFKSKEDFALKAAEYYADMVEEFFRTRLLHSDLPYAERLEFIFDDEMERVKANDFKEGCILGDLSSEVAGEMEEIRVLVESKLKAWQDVIERYLIEGQNAGYFKKEVDPLHMAIFFLSSRQGTLARVKSMRSIKPYQVFKASMMMAIVK
ncbi:MAG: TetR family transcriptional regulator C-terminal domain-containing protein [Ekhidna sp.]